MRKKPISQHLEGNNIKEILMVLMAIYFCVYNRFKYKLFKVMEKMKFSLLYTFTYNNFYRILLKYNNEQTFYIIFVSNNTNIP